MLERPPEQPRRLGLPGQASGGADCFLRLSGALPVLIESEPRLYSRILTRFLHANRYKLRSKTRLRANR